MTSGRRPQALFGGESLEQALRQLTAFDTDGLPVLSADGSRIQGWVTDADIIRAISRSIHDRAEATRTVRAATRAVPAEAATRTPPTPLPGYHVIEVTIQPGTPAAGAVLGSLTWPPGTVPVSGAITAPAPPTPA